MCFARETKKIRRWYYFMQQAAAPLSGIRIYCFGAIFFVYAIDLIGESSKSILTKKMKTPQDNAMWLDETLAGLRLDKVFLCGLSIGGWNAANYAGFYPKKVIKLILLSPVQTLAKMYLSQL